MKNKKAFTLIELLAVIVVLAIIALITTPIVTKTIESSKKGVAIESANNLIHSAELYFITTSPKYGKIDVLSDKLSYKGTKPELGEVEIDKEGKSRLYAYINGYCVTKEYSGEVYASKTNKDNCDWYGTDNYETKEGTTFTLNNQEVKNYLIYGNSEQEVRSGKNIFNSSAWSTSVTGNGLTIQYLEDEDCFLINGTTTLATDFASKYINIPSEANTSYVLSSKYVSGSIDRTNGAGYKYAVAYFGNGDTTNTYANWYSINLENEDIINTSMVNDKNYITRFWFYVDKGITFNDYKVRIQLEKGSEATEYEEYGAMPSPEYPSEVKSTGDLITNDNCNTYGNDACDNVGKYVIQVKSSRKNLFDKNNYTKNSKNILQFDISNLEIGKTYKFSSNIPIIWFKISDQDGGYNSVGARDTSGFKEYTFTMARDYHIDSSIKQYLYLGIDTNYFVDNIDDLNDYNFQIEEGTEATSYEEYVEPKITNIYLDEPLRKIGDYADYIDFENKKVVRKIKSLKLSSDDRFVLTGASGFDYQGFALHSFNYNAASGLFKNKSNRFTYASESSVKINSCSQTNQEYGIRFVASTSIVPNKTVEEFKNWIDNNPTWVYYVLETPTEETVDLPSIETLNGTSTLSINTEVGPSNIRLTTSK